jgi:hypothetical protein
MSRNIVDSVKRKPLLNYPKDEEETADQSKDKMTDLTNYLFAQLERLNDKNLKGEGLKEEICRAESMGKVAGRIIDIGNLTLKANVAADNAFGNMGDKKKNSKTGMRLLLE